MHSIGLYSFIDRPTRISNHSFTLIDNVFTNVTNHKVTSGILVSDITAHLPIFVFCTYPNPNRADQKCNVKKRIIYEKALLLLSNNLAEEVLTRKLTHLNFPTILNAMRLILSVNKALLTDSIISLWAWAPILIIRSL